MTGDFLQLVRAAKHGRLKIYLGMAAGVGKTVAMLREAKRLRTEGLDVAIGFVETHGRAGTVSEIESLESVPRRTIVYRDVPLEEMNLEAILARRPEVVVVDELAHTNVPGSQNGKRWQDVEALLDAGISVLGAMNVQHLDSLHDLVLRATGVDVRERVPDRFLARANEVVIVDLAPDDLRERLRQGKVYPPEKVERALHGFFRDDNLRALRQLALREVANAVEDRARAVSPERPGDPSLPAPRLADAERVLVAMSSRPSATRHLLRHGARLAGGPNAKWFVVHVRTPSESPQRIDTRAMRSLAENVELAHELGAEIVRLEGVDIPATLARFARERSITHAVFGRTRIAPWRERLRGSVLDRFMRLAPDVDVLVVAGREESSS